MIKSFLVHPAATFSTRSIFQRNAVVLVLTFALTCAVFLTTHQILASAPTSSRTDEHHEVKLVTSNPKSDLSRVDSFPLDSNIKVRVLSSVADLITTIAGDGTRGYGGDGGPATSAKLTTPFGVAVDASGNVYIADTGNDRIRMVTITGTITTVAGSDMSGYGGDGELATRAQLDFPTGIAIDTSGNVYIADTNNNCIRMVTNPGSSGIITTVAGDGTYGCTGDEGLATLARLDGPTGVAIDASGNVFIADSSCCRIRVVTKSTGYISNVAGDGTCTFDGDGGLATLAKLRYPHGVAVDASGNIYIADTINNRIRMVTKSDSIISTVAGDESTNYITGGPAISTGLSVPYHVTLDASGNIYFADAFNNRILMVTKSNGIISTVAGDGTSGSGGDEGPAISAQLDLPRGLCLDASGNIYIADTKNARVRKVGQRALPTASPSPLPTASPSPLPTALPSPSPTALPSPSPTALPSPSPTALPSPSPTGSPVLLTASCKTKSPISPSTRPTKSPVTAKPTKMPRTAKPTKMPVMC